MTDEALEILLALATALAAGFVVGAEREQGAEATFGGIRTFPLYGLAGGVGMLLGTWALVAIGLSFGALLAIAYYRDTRDPRRIGMSTEVAAVVTFALGALCTARDLAIPLSDRLLLVAAGATATLALLSVKEPLHRLVGKVSEEDVYATTKLLVLAVIVLPLLPDAEMGPWGAINPRSVGLLVLLISAISFAGYVAIRALGAHRGLGLTGLFGGLASSTAVTLTFFGRAREQPGLVNACAVAVVLASATMFPRVVAEVSAVSPELASAALAAFLAAAAVGLAAAVGAYYWFVRRDGADGETGLRLQNPFTLERAFQFALLFLAVLAVSRGAAIYFEERGVYLSAALTGLAGADAIALSVARLHERGEIDGTVALHALALSSGANTVAKIAIAAVLGGRALGLRVGGALLAALAAGALVLLV